MRIRHLVEGEGTVDDGLERAGLQTLGDKLDRGFAAGFITTRERHVVRLDGRHLGDHFEHRQWGDTGAEQAVDVDDATGGQCRDEFGETRAADRIEGDASALAIGDSRGMYAQLAAKETSLAERLEGKSQRRLK